MVNDKVMGEASFKTILELARKANPTSDDKTNLNNKVKELNIA